MENTTRIAALVSLALGLAAVSPCAAQDLDVVLRAEFPADLVQVPSAEPFGGVPDPGYQATLPGEAAATAILEEARWTFSGMVWGFDFTYTPSDKARAIQELFVIKPRGELAWGTPGVSVSAVRREGASILATVAWSPWPAARAELSAWSAAGYGSAQGRGSAPAVVGAEPGMELDGRYIPSPVMARRAAVTDAMRAALRAFLVSVERSKPREVRGSCSLAAPPRVVMSSGAYVATVRLRVAVDEVISYGGY